MKPNKEKSCISAVILAGGRGSRFDHQDKGLVTWKNKTLVAHVIDRLTPQCSDIVISCNRNREQYQALGYPTVIDELTDFQGPLAGLAASLNLCQCERALVVPCDAPLLPANLAQRLSTALSETGKPLAYARDANREQYLFAIMQKSLISDLQRYLEQGNRSVHGWYSQLGAASVDFSGQEAAFTNINSLKELNQIS